MGVFSLALPLTFVEPKASQMSAQVFDPCWLYHRENLKYLHSKTFRHGLQCVPLCSTKLCLFKLAAFFF